MKGDLLVVAIGSWSFTVAWQYRCMGMCSFCSGVLQLVGSSCPFIRQVRTVAASFFSRGLGPDHLSADSVSLSHRQDTACTSTPSGAVTSFGHCVALCTDIASPFLFLRIFHWILGPAGLSC